MAHPSLAVLAVMASLLFGKATWVVPLILVLGPALAGVLPTFYPLPSGCRPGCGSGPVSPTP